MFGRMGGSNQLNRLRVAMWKNPAKYKNAGNRGLPSEHSGEKLPV